MTVVVDPAPKLRAIDGGEIFVYPIPSGQRVDNHDFMAMQFRRYLASRFRALASLDTRGAFLELMQLAYDDTPVGTLPMDDRIHARKLGISLEHWVDLTRREVSPLDGWARCLCDNGEIRLYHPDLLMIVERAMEQRDSKIEKREADRERKRLSQLPYQMAAAGAPKRMCEDQAAVCRLDSFLVENLQGKQRRVTVVRVAMEALELRDQGRDWLSHIEENLS